MARYTHDLLPMPYTFAAAKNTAAEDREVAGLSGSARSASRTSAATPSFTSSEMTEWEFLSEVVEQADCGILLDVNNIYVSIAESQLRSVRLSERRAARPRRADPHRRA